MIRRSVKISLCHTTARLPRSGAASSSGIGMGWLGAYNSWMKAADKPTEIEYILSVDQARLLELDYPKTSTVRDIDRVNVTLAVNRGRRCAVDGWNAAAEAATGDLLVTVADDWFPPEHWDTEFLRAIPDLEGDYVLDVDNQDSAYPLLPFSILTRGYLNRLRDEYGYSGFFYGDYFGMMADCEFTDLARRDRVVIDARYMKFLHLDPATDKNPDALTAWDETYRWQRRDEATQRGKEVYVRRIQELGIKKPGFIPLEMMKPLEVEC